MFAVEGRPAPRPGESDSAVYRVIFPGYFRTMNITLLRGRDITEADNLNAPDVVVINEQMAKRYWPGADPVGKRITLGRPGEESIVGDDCWRSERRQAGHLDRHASARDVFAAAAERRLSQVAVGPL